MMFDWDIYQSLIVEDPIKMNDKQGYRYFRKAPRALRQVASLPSVSTILLHLSSAGVDECGCVENELYHGIPHKENHDRTLDLGYPIRQTHVATDAG